MRITCLRVRGLTLVVGMAAMASWAGAGTTFRDDFSGPTLDPAWTVNPGYGTYSLTANPGYLRYTLNSSVVSSGYDTRLAFYRQFTGTDWVLDGKASYSMPSGLGRDFYQIIAFGGYDQRFTLSAAFDRNRDDGSRSNIARAWWNDPGPGGPGGESSYYPTVLPDTYYFRIERAGQEVKVEDSSDGVTYTTMLDRVYTTPLGSTQTLVLEGTDYYSSGQANWDYVQVTTAVPLPTAAWGGLGLLGSLLGVKFLKSSAQRCKVRTQAVA